MARRKNGLENSAQSAIESVEPPTDQTAEMRDGVGSSPTKAGAEPRDNRQSKPGRGRGRPFAPGNKANPGGRPKQIKEVRDLARQHTPAAITKLVELMGSDNPSAATAACRELLDRAWGKSSQAITGLEENDGVITIKVVE